MIKGPTLSPVRLLCLAWDPSQYGNFLDFQHLRMENRKNVICMQLKKIPAQYCLISKILHVKGVHHLGKIIVDVKLLARLQWHLCTVHFDTGVHPWVLQILLLISCFHFLHVLKLTCVGFMFSLNLRWFHVFTFDIFLRKTCMPGNMVSFSLRKGPTTGECASPWGFQLEQHLKRGCIYSCWVCFESSLIKTGWPEWTSRRGPPQRRQREQASPNLPTRGRTSQAPEEQEH